jgi:hypothetical protein
MAKESGPDKPAGELRQEIDLSRERVTRDLRGLRYELDFPRKIRKSFQTQTLLWIGGALAIGAMFTLLSRGKKKVYLDVKGGAKSQNKLLVMGFTLGALRIASNLLKPVIVNFLEKKVRNYTSEPRPGKKQ